MTAGRPGLKIPAFSTAINSRVSPSHCVWSSPIVVTAATSGATTFVESSLPPRPTSTTAMSGAAAAK
jgi:hypothetical protein